MTCIPRQLSDPEYVQFLTDVDIAGLGLPPWGGFVNWGGLTVMVYQVPDGGTWLTDVTACSSSTVNYPKTYTAHSAAYFFPQEFMGQFYDDIRAQLQQVGSQIAAVSTFVGQNILKPALEPVWSELALLAIIGVSVLVFMYGPKRS